MLLERRLLGCGPGPRIALLSGLGLAWLAAVVKLLPVCVAAPYAGLPEEVRYWFDNVSEARSLLDLFGRNPVPAVAFSALPLVALAFLGERAMRRGSRDDPRWMALAALVLATAAAMGWQIRSAPQAGLVAAAALVPWAAKVNRSAAELTTYLGRLSARLLVPVACLTLMLIVPSWIGRTLGTAQPPAEPCELSPALTILNDPDGLGALPRTVAAPINLGPALLLLTGHSALAAPVHRNVRGLVDHRRLFGGTEAEALSVVKARGVAAILFCNRYAWVTRHPDRPGYLNERLAAGEPPTWLVPALTRDGMALYLVRLAGNAE